jgi:isopentenyl-diphosphate delta-isomerase
MPLNPNTDEVMDTRWITPQDLREEIAATPENFTPWLRIYLDQHHEMILGTV